MTTFEDFWNLYPRKQSKGDAIKAWGQVTKQHDPAEIVAGLENQLHYLQAQERRFTKLPGTWLRAWCWLDEIGEQPQEGFRDRTKLPFDEWSQQDKRAAADYLKHHGAERFLAMGYTQEHLDRLRGPVLVSEERRRA